VIAVVVIANGGAAAPAKENAKEKSAEARQAVPAPDLPKLIECRATVADYGSLAFGLMGDGGIAARMKWTEVKPSNPFLKEYALPKPIRVFGHLTSHIAFASAGILAVLDDVAPKELATSLGLKPAFPDLKNKVMFAKTILAEDTATLSTKIVLSASAVDSHPGKTLAGCEYRFEVK